MANLTKNGVCYELTNSPFYSHYKGMAFYFSSIKHKDAFDSKVQVRVPWLNDSISRRFKFSVNMEWVAVIQLYRQVETRGFLIIDYVKGVTYRCLDEIVLDGLHLKLKDSTGKDATIIDE